MKLKGKTALVTGASRGIGRAIALELAREGANVVVNYSRSREEALKVAEEIKKVSRALAVQADVSREDDVKGLVKATLKEFGRIDILVNNAGIYNRKDFEDIQLKDWEETMRINLTSMFLCTREIIPHMKANRFGRIVNMSSLGAEKGGAPKGVHYVTSKAGVIGLTKALAKIGEGYNIRVNAIAPGPIDSGMIQDDTPEVRMGRIETTITKSIGKPEDVAKAVIFLVSSDSDYITGEVIHLDGGMRLK